MADTRPFPRSLVHQLPASPAYHYAASSVPGSMPLTGPDIPRSSPTTLPSSSSQAPSFAQARPSQRQERRSPYRISSTTNFNVLRSFLEKTDEGKENEGLKSVPCSSLSGNSIPASQPSSSSVEGADGALSVAKEKRECKPTSQLRRSISPPSRSSSLLQQTLVRKRESALP
ncbi:MAG: hypothetical protein M1829_005860 [Trizodia sp. TS-e1964]|nr:MAG: hypothetical protein M1829_005860 [Trizodia sp. TS-e1964]